MTMLYPASNFNRILNKRKKWVIQKNIEAEEKWAQKKDELEKKIRKSNFNG